MSSRNSPRIVQVAQWLRRLSTLTRSPTKITQVALSDYTKLLKAEFSDSLFTDEALQRIASEFQFFPSFSTLKVALIEIEKERQLRLLEHPMADSLRERVDQITNSPEHKQRQDELVASVKADWSNRANVRSSLAKLETSPMRLVLGKMLAGLLVKHAPRNLDILPPEFIEMALKSRERDEKAEAARQPRPVDDI
jgi:hypothetical protein